jgi:hypothetical protein
LQTQTQSSLRWAENENYDFLLQDFVPTLAERISFSAFQPVSGDKASFAFCCKFTMSELPCHLSLLYATDTSIVLDMIRMLQYIIFHSYLAILCHACQNKLLHSFVYSMSFLHFLLFQPRIKLSVCEKHFNIKY